MTSIAQNFAVLNQAGYGGPADLDLSALQPGTLPGALDTGLPWLRDLVNVALKLNTSSTNDGVVDSNGAPALDLPITDFSGDELALMLAAIDNKIKEAQGKTAKEGIEAARLRTESANKEMATKLQEALDKQKEADEKAKEQKVWGWIAKIAAVIGAIVAVITTAAATIASGGAAAPLLALAVVGLVAATVDLASAINQEVNPDAEAFTLGSLIGDAIIDAMDKAGISGEARAAFSGMSAALGFMLMQPDLAGQMAEDAAIADGRDPEFAANLRMGVMIAAVVTTIVVMIAVTVASGGGNAGNMAGSAAKTGAQVADTAVDAATVATKAADMAAKINKAARIIGGIASVTQGTASIGSASVGIEAAKDIKAADEARADAKKLDAVLLALQAQSEEQVQRLKDIITALEEGMNQFTQMIATAGDQRANQIKNLVRA